MKKYSKIYVTIQERHIKRIFIRDIQKKTFREIYKKIYKGTYKAIYGRNLQKDIWKDI